MSRESSVVVVGAGMAGLSAARRLVDGGKRVVVVEARERLGGRVWTDRDFADVPVELGAEFIHGDGANTWQYVRELGLRTLHWNKLDDSLVRTEDGRWLTMAQARAADPELDATRAWDLPEVPARRYEDLAGYLKRIGFSRNQLRYVERWFANAQGENMRFLSAAGTLQALRRSVEDGHGDYRLVDGYEAVPNFLARGLDVRLSSPVSEIRWGGAGVNAICAGGESFEAEALIVTVPVGVLHAGSIRFLPELPDEKARALSGLRMGPVIKLIYRFAAPIAEPQTMAIYSRYNPPMWWSPSCGHPQGEGQVWTAFVSGEAAAALLASGERGALAAGVRALSSELGRTLEAVDSRLIDWPGDQYSRGGYSYLLPGHDGARELLAHPVPPLFFAGEASAAEHQAATVHGAIETGRRAADEVSTFLDGRPRAGEPAARTIG